MADGEKKTLAQQVDELRVLLDQQTKQLQQTADRLKALEAQVDKARGDGKTPRRSG